MPNQHSAPWNEDAIRIAVDVLGTCETLSEAVSVLEVHLSRPVSANALLRAFRRRGLEAPGHYLAKHPPPKESPPPPPLGVSTSPVSDSAASDSPRRSGPSPERVYLVCSDVHVPAHSIAVMDAFAAIGRDVSADGIVVAGDYLDLAEVSRHTAGSVAQLEGRRVVDSFADGRALLRHLVNAIDCTDNYFVDGNHEDRINRWLRSGDNAIWIGSDAMAIDRALEMRDLGFQYRDGWPDAFVNLGHLVVTHGRFTNRYHAAKHLDTWRCAVMYGHTHTPQVHYVPGHKSQQVAIGLGLCADMDHEAMKYAAKPHGWQNGFGLVAVRPSGVFHAEQINFYDGVASFGGHLYGRGGRI